jgi:hypothetical protein
MKLYEEFKEYENLWDESLKEEKEFRSEYARLRSTAEGRAELERLRQTDRAAFRKIFEADCELDPVNKLAEKVINSLPDIEFEYDGFYADFDEPAYYSDFTYSVEAGDVYLLITGEYKDSGYKYFTSKCSKKVLANKTVQKWIELNKAYENASIADEDDAWETLGIFEIENFEELVDLFSDVLHDYYKEEAQEWAIDCREPVDDDYFRDYYYDE